MNTQEIKRTITRHHTEIARNLKVIWERKKHQLHLKQVDAAKQLEWTQPTLNQYLNGRIALNTEAVLKFAALLKVNPNEIDPNLVFIQQKRILHVINTGKTVQLPASHADCTAFVLDNKYAPKLTTGDYAVLNPTTQLRVGLRVLAYDEHQHYVIGEIKGITNDTTTIIDRNTNNTLELNNKEFTIQEVESLIVW